MRVIPSNQHRILSILIKQIRCIFQNLKKLNKSSQQKTIKFIERQLVSIKKFAYLCRKSKIYACYARSGTKNLQRNACLTSIQDVVQFENNQTQNYSNSVDVIENNLKQFHSEVDLVDCKDDELEKSAIPTITALSNDESLSDSEQNSNDQNEISGDDNNDDEMQQWKKNTQIRNDVKNLCILCKKKFKSRHSLIKHIFKHPGTPQSCLKCRTTFNNATVYKYHIVNGVCSSDLQENFEIFRKSFCEKNFYCPYCGNRYSKTFNLRRHLEICDFLNSTFCNVCKSHLSSEAEYQKHCTRHEKNRCKKCDAIFSSRVLLRKHHNSTHRIKKPSTVYSCETCDIVFPNRVLYREHMKNYKDDKKHIEAKKAATDKIWCSVCKKSFAQMKTYKRHCSRQNHLKMTQQEAEIKPYICEICGLVLKNNTSLRGHLADLHSDKTPLMCEMCPYLTTKTSNMNRHKQMQHTQGPKNFACDKCPMLFSTSHTLKNHIAALHSLERPFSCSMCPKTFKLSTQLKRHSVVHDPVAPYPCNFCTTGFRRYSQLQRHIASKHNEHIQNNLNPNEIQEPEVLKDKSTLKTVPTPTATTSCAQEEEMFSLIDVQSGELVLLSVKDMSKNDVINMTTEGDLLNSVHIQDLWNNTDSELYSIDPMLQDNRNADPAFMMPGNSEPQLDDVSKNMMPVYAPQYIHPDGKDMEMLPGGFDLVKENMLPQNNMDTQMIVTTQSYGGCVDYCTIVMEQ